ncbi:MAG: hypothetical protein LBB65_06275 [Burkholderiales bacterium]|nr:hypothetical protein [Burkholderiales bacterium]
MLIEVLISVLLFALGIVALVGLQARSFSTTDDMQYRTEAIHLANAYMGQIWASGLQGSALEVFQTKGEQWGDFRDRVVGLNGFQGIPGGQPPIVTVTDTTITDTPAGGTAPVTMPIADITITISWLDRDGITKHNYVQTSSIGY